MIPKRAEDSVHLLGRKPVNALCPGRAGTTQQKATNGEADNASDCYVDEDGGSQRCARQKRRTANRDPRKHSKQYQSDYHHVICPQISTGPQRFPAHNKQKFINVAQ